MLLDHFDALISKMIFLKKNYFNTFLSEKHFKKQPQTHSQTGFRGYLVMWLRVRFTRSHRYYRLVKEKTQVYAGRTHKKYGCAKGFVKAQFYYFSWGRNHWTVEPCSTVALFIKVNSAVNFNPLALFTWIVFFFWKPVQWIDFTRTVHITWTVIFFVFLKNSFKVN